MPSCLEPMQSGFCLLFHLHPVGAGPRQVPFDHLEVSGVVGRDAFLLDAPVVPMKTFGGAIEVRLLESRSTLAGCHEDFVAVSDEDGADDGPCRVNVERERDGTVGFKRHVP